MTDSVSPFHGDPKGSLFLCLNSNMDDKEQAHPLRFFMLKNRPFDKQIGTICLLLVLNWF